LKPFIKITSDSSTIIKEFHDEIARLQMQIQKIELAISNAYKSKKIKKYNKDKKHNKKDKKRNNKVKDKDKKKNKKKAKSLKMKKQK
jgi:hypothetical protein